MVERPKIPPTPTTTDLIGMKKKTSRVTQTVDNSRWEEKYNNITYTQNELRINNKPLVGINVIRNYLLYTVI